MSGTAVEAQWLEIGYRNGRDVTTVLSDVDLTVPSGEFLTVLGPSGCGKSTLLRVVANLLDPLGGQITVLGNTPEAARRARKTGFVFQDATLLPWRTVGQNIRLPAVVGGRQARQLPDTRIAELMALLDGADAVKFAKHKPGADVHERALRKAIGLVEELSKEAETNNDHGTA